MALQDPWSIYLSPVGELEPGTIFAGHRIEMVAGRGGMGVVYKATQLALDRTVALKVIAAGLLEDQTVRARFVRESKVAASIDHPNVIPIYYAGEEQGIAYIAMRYVAGDDVRSLVRREGPLNPERAARIASQLGSALDAAHAAGLVHRDIKPANVLMGPDDHVYLTDFGLTKHALSVAGSTKPGHWVGTLDYVAPEQIRGERVDARVDVYALGCLLYFTLTGEVPFKRDGDEARLWAHLQDPPPKPSEHDAGIPEAFDYVVARAMAKDPEER
jgi:serine/threonine protein kinase